jgi:uncharacterized membrane protein YedE/YeeE
VVTGGKSADRELAVGQDNLALVLGCRKEHAVNRAQRKAIISAVMVVTLAISAIVTIPIASRYSQTAAQQAVTNKEKPTAVAKTAVIPTLIAVIGSMLLGIGAGLVAGDLLPLAEPPARRGRRR